MSTMTDEEYREGRDLLARAEDARVDVFVEAQRRGDVFALHAWFYHSRIVWNFLTFEDAVERAQDDCKPVTIIGPDGTQYDPYTGKAKENNA